MNTCPICNAKIDLSREPYRCAAGVFSPEQCLMMIENVQLAAMCKDSIPSPPLQSVQRSLNEGANVICEG